MAHPPPSLEYLPFCRAKTVVKCASAGQLTRSRTIGQLLLLKQNDTDKNFRRATSNTPKICQVMSPLVIGFYAVYMYIFISFNLFEIYCKPQNKMTKTERDKVNWRIN